MTDEQIDEVIEGWQNSFPKGVMNEVNRGRFGVQEATSIDTVIMLGLIVKELRRLRKKV